MKVQPKALWEQCLQLIKENVTEQQYTTWFKPITFETFDATTSILWYKSQVHSYTSIWEENYVNLLSKVLTRVFGKGIHLKYRIVTDKTHNLTQDIQSDTVDNVETQLPTNRANQSPTPLDAVLQDIDPQLDLHKSFSNYIEGDSNKLPRSIGLSIAEHSNTTQFNPMFIFGPSGCGKTHLINAIGLKIKTSFYPTKNVFYIYLPAYFRCNIQTLF